MPSLAPTLVVNLGSSRHLPVRGLTRAPPARCHCWSRGLELTGDGAAWLAGLGITVPAGRRPLVRSCVDWTERRPHLAGAAGAALCAHALGAGWVTRVGGGRAVAVTRAGQDALSEHLGLDNVTPERAAS
jgi:hypothetical protein